MMPPSWQWYTHHKPRYTINHDIMVYLRAHALINQRLELRLVSHRRRPGTHVGEPPAQPGSSWIPWSLVISQYIPLISPWYFLISHEIIIMKFPWNHRDVFYILIHHPSIFWWKTSRKVRSCSSITLTVLLPWLRGCQGLGPAPP
jgi:hypothetical protein